MIKLNITDGQSKKILIGKREISFKKTTAKNMKTAGRISGLVIQALRYLGKDHVTIKHVRIIKRKLAQADKKRLLLDADLAPRWISKIIKNKILEGFNG